MGFFGSFFGSDQRKDLQRADAQASAALKEGYDKGYGDYTGAMQGYDAYTQSGQRSQKTYDDLLGLNGPEARAAAQALYASDPYQQNALEQSQNAMTRFGNARGFGSGQYALAGQRIATQNYGNWMDRYRQGGEMGLNATNARAGVQTGRGDMSYGYGATKAGQAINMGNAMAASRNIGLNNLLAVAGTAAKFMPGGGMGGGAGGGGR